MDTQSSTLPKNFIFKRLQSLMGLWLVGFLIIHLLSNSQAALFLGENGSGFIHSANSIRELPYLQAIEIFLLAIPFAIHMYWGVQYLFTGQYNSTKSDGTTPALPEYPRNHAYTWQRITSWILLFLITFHVIQMRFLEEPATVQRDATKYYMVRVNADDGIRTLSKRLGVTLYDSSQIASESAVNLRDSSDPLEMQTNKQTQEWIQGLNSRQLNDNQLMAVANNFGTAELLMVRETFKRPDMIVLYTVLVLSACFHAFNGLWTFCITWGITLSQDAQRRMRKLSIFLMFLIGFLGLAAVWGTYWINLRQ